MVYKVGEEEIQAIGKVIRSYKFDRYIDSAKSVTAQFERIFSEKIGTPYCLAVSSGTAALICGFVGMGIGPGDEVIIPAYTYIATALAVLAVGAIPVIVEIDESLTIDTIDILKKITSKTKAIVPVHMRGLPCNMEEIIKISKKGNFFVLEDVAQACGGSYQGVRLGSLGHAGMFSFNHYKNITCGEGGALVTKDSMIQQRALIQHHGGYIYETNTQDININFPGCNFRLSEISSAMMLVQLKRLDAILSALRDEKRIIIKYLISASKIFKKFPVHDIEGDCGSNVFFTLESKEQTEKLLQHAQKEKIDIWSAHTKGHVYCDWKPIIDQRRSGHNSINPFDINRNKYVYHTDMCPKTLDILSRTIGISTQFERLPRKLYRIIEKLVSIAKEVE